jgi:hypothetical protein
VSKILLAIITAGLLAAAVQERVAIHPVPELANRTGAAGFWWRDNSSSSKSGRGVHCALEKV